MNFQKSQKLEVVEQKVAEELLENLNKLKNGILLFIIIAGYDGRKN